MKIQNRPPKAEFSCWLRLRLAEAQSRMAVTAEGLSYLSLEPMAFVFQRSISSSSVKTDL